MIPGFVYMVSPCGRHADFFPEDSAPEWTPADDMSDAEVGALMMRRMKDNDKKEN